MTLVIPASTRSVLYCDTSHHDHVIHFKTSNPHIIAAENNPAATVTWSPSDWATGFTPLTDHTGFLPEAATGMLDSESLTEFPFYVSSEYHWGIRALNGRWECDSPGSGAYSHRTTHHIWVR
jgi:hypothetical protein